MIWDGIHHHTNPNTPPKMCWQDWPAFVRHYHLQWIWTTRHLTLSNLAACHWDVNPLLQEDTRVEKSVKIMGGLRIWGGATIYNSLWTSLKPWFCRASKSLFDQVDIIWYNSLDVLRCCSFKCRILFIVTSTSQHVKLFFARDTYVKTRDIILFGIGSCFSKLSRVLQIYQQPCKNTGEKTETWTRSLVVVFSTSRFLQLSMAPQYVWPWWGLFGMGFFSRWWIFITHFDSGIIYTKTQKRHVFQRTDAGWPTM